VGAVGVHHGQHLAGRGRKTRSKGRAFPPAPRVGNDPGARAIGQGRGLIGGMVVDHDQFRAAPAVSPPAVQGRPRAGHEIGKRFLLVVRRDHHRQAPAFEGG